MERRAGRRHAGRGHRVFRRRQDAARNGARARGGIGQFNLESEEEGVELAAIAHRMGKRAVGALRVNPDVDAGPMPRFPPARPKTSSACPMTARPGSMRGCPRSDGLECAGWRSTSAARCPILNRSRLLSQDGRLMRALRAQGLPVTHMDLGGGSACPTRRARCCRRPKNTPRWSRGDADWDATLMFEPGRVIAGNSGVLVTQVIRVKPGASRLRRRRCGDERSCAPRDVRCLARFRGREAQR
jgi:diaminopimelate decarboxylase